MGYKELSSKSKNKSTELAQFSGTLRDIPIELVHFILYSLYENATHYGLSDQSLRDFICALRRSKLDFN